MRPPLFVELCAGTAALSLRLAHPRARPPVSRMGAKTGYADVILRCMGLRPGQGAEHYLWCEPDAGVRLLLHAYRDRELATAAAGIIRSWKNEEPRALWKRLRAEGPAVCPPVDPRGIARCLVNGSWSFGGDWRGGFYRSGTIGNVNSCRPPKDCALIAAACSECPTIPATIADDARQVGPPQLAPGVVVYIDPPYRGTTGYGRGCDLPRSEWLPVVRRWQAAGALVVVSEAEPIAELVANGWHAVDISGERAVGRTFSKQQAEWLTLSRPPAWRPSIQVGLFGR